MQKPWPNRFYLGVKTKDCGCQSKEIGVGIEVRLLSVGARGFFLAASRLGFAPQFRSLSRGFFLVRGDRIERRSRFRLENVEFTATLFENALQAEGKRRLLVFVWMENLSVKSGAFLKRWRDKYNVISLLITSTFSVAWFLFSFLQKSSCWVVTN